MKKHKILDTVLPSKRQSHKKRNALIGVGLATAAVVIIGAIEKGRDQTS